MDWMLDYEKKFARKKYFDAFVEFSIRVLILTKLPGLRINDLDGGATRSRLNNKRYLGRLSLQSKY